MHFARVASLALAGVVLAGCAEGDPSTVEQPTASPTASPTVSLTPTSALPAGIDHLVTVTIRGGKVSGPEGRVKVPRGDVVRLVVTSDVADEVHLHGYDKKVAVPAGGTVHLDFTASIAGIFEVELEEHTLTITRFQVQ